MNGALGIQGFHDRTTCPFPDQMFGCPAPIQRRIEPSSLLLVQSPLHTVLRSQVLPNSSSHYLGRVLTIVVMQIAVYEYAQEHYVHKAKHNPKLDPLPFDRLFTEIPALGRSCPASTKEMD
jgi:hypothetical protein